VIQALLENGTISENDRGQAIKNAAGKGGHLPVILALLENGAISERDRGEAVRYAANKGYYFVIQALLENGTISENDRCSALETAQQSYGFEEIVELLKSKRPWWKFWGI